MTIRRYRYAWEPTVYRSADNGAPAGGNTNGTPPAGQQGGDQGQQGQQQQGQQGGDGKGGDPPKGDAKFTQADLDRIVAQRLEDEKQREKKRTEKARQEAAEEAARKNGEWEKVAESRQSRIAELEGDLERLKGEIATARLEAARERVAAKHKLPPALAARLRGDDEAALDADAKELAKLLVVTAPDTQAGAGGGASADAKAAMRKAHELAAAQNPRYTPF